MRTLTVILAALTFTGCAAPKLSRHAVDGARQVQTAAVHVAKAQAAGERAKQSIATGKQAAAELKRTATPAQKPHVERLESSLAVAQRENEIMRVSLDEVAPRLDAAQTAIDNLGAELLTAERQAADYRSLKLWLALFGAAGAAYVAFRMIPPIGPVRYYSMVAAGGLAGTLIYTRL